MTAVLDIKTHELITCTDSDLQIYSMSVCNQSLTSCNYFRMQEEEEEEAGHFSSVVFLCQVRWIEVSYTRTFACGTGSRAIPGFTARWTPASWLPQASFASPVLFYNPSFWPACAKRVLRIISCGWSNPRLWLTDFCKLVFCLRRQNDWQDSLYFKCS